MPTIAALLLLLASDPSRACAAAHRTPGVTLLSEDGWDPDLRTVLVAGDEGHPARVAHVRCDEDPGALLAQAD